jgi:cytochrome oxidase Cu insertion factor (SCO1/SenC/PrrC family)
MSIPWTPRTDTRPAGSRFGRFLAALAVSAGLGLAGEATAVVPGNTAPDFTLNDVNGTPFTLSSYRGKAVLLVLAGYD